LKLTEPKIDVTSENYTSQLAHAFSFYNMNFDKKDARAYMRTYLKVSDKSGDSVKVFDQVPDSFFVSTYGWLARIKSNGFSLRSDHEDNFAKYVINLLIHTPRESVAEKPIEEVNVKPTIQDYMKEKVKEYMGELEGVLDDFIKEGKPFSLYNDLKTKNIPKQFGNDIIEWADKKTVEFAQAYESTDGDLKEGYSNLGKRKLSQLIKLVNEFVEDVNRYSEFKKANRKIRAKKVKPASQQVAKMKYKKEDTEARVTSVHPSEMVGASQVWVYNSKYKKLAVYRSESTQGIQVKGSTLQNYDPELCEQKVVRRPEAFLPTVLKASKVQLRKVMENLTTKGSDVTGRINEECIILRVIK